MILQFSFERFDPFNGEIPNRDTSDFAYIAERARKLLKSRNRIEIESQLKDIDFLIGWGERDFHVNQALDENYFVSPVIVLRFIANTPSEEQSPALSKVIWSEYFSVLALALIGQSADLGNAELSRMGLSLAEIEDHNRRTIQSLVVDSLDAVNAAESFYEREQQIAEASNRGKPGAHARHAASDALRKMALEIYERDYASKDVSNANAARHIWKKVEQYNKNANDKEIIKPEGAEDRIARWISQYKSQK